MRTSPLRHPVAILRTKLNLLQDELAALVGYSKLTIQSVELKRLDLSFQLAALISAKTGADINWLLKGDPKIPMPKLKKGKPTEQGTLESYKKFTPRLMAIAARAKDREESDFANYIIEKSIRQLETRYGISTK